MREGAGMEKILWHLFFSLDEGRVSGEDGENVKKKGRRGGR